MVQGSKTADIGLTGGGKNTHQVYISGVANQIKR